MRTREEKMELKTKKYIGLIITILGFLTILLGITILIVKWYNFGNVTNEDIIFASIPITLGLGTFALGISIQSDFKMDINSNENFLRIIDDFEDRRIELFQDIHYRQSFTMIISSCWKFCRYTTRALKLHDMSNIELENQTQLYEQVVQLVLMSDLPWGTMSQGVYIMRADDINNVLTTCEDCLFLDLNNEQKEQLWNLITFIEQYR